MPLIHALLVLIAVFLDYLLGEPKRFHPLAGFGRLAVVAEGVLYGASRPPAAWLRFAGLLAWAILVLPFVLLVSRAIKRRPLLLAVTGGYVAAMCWIDIYWLVIPEFSPGVARFGLLDVLCFLGMNGVFSAVVLIRLSRHSVVAERDPRLEESLVFKNA